MRRLTCEEELLRRLAEAPFADRLDLAALTGRSPSAVYGAAAELEAAGLAAALPHATALIASTRRYCLTAAGVRRLARAEGVTVERLLRTRPVSAHWRRLLLERLDAVAVIYRLAAALCGLGRPLRIRWYRASPLDAALFLPDGTIVGVVRQGAATDRTAFSKRLRRLYEGPLPGAVLVLLPDEVRLRHARRLLRGAPLTAFLALEAHVAIAGSGDRIWRLPSLAGGLTLDEALAAVPGRGLAPVESLPGRVFLSRPFRQGDTQLAPSVLAPAAKRFLDTLFDWPWITPSHLAGLLGVSGERASRLAARLEAMGLAGRIPLARRTLLVPADRGIALLARRDRASVGVAWRRWSTGPIDAGAPPDWRDVAGSRSRQLLRNLDHTEAVHGFMAALAVDARRLGWEVVQLDPPHRASRYFRHQERLHSVRPDAFGLLQRYGRAWPFFLEWERRAVRPVTMRRRLAPYLRYFASERPLEDHGARPAVLIIFDGELAAAHFLRVARVEMERTGVEVPLQVSHRAVFEDLGPLEPAAWRRAGEAGAAGGGIHAGRGTGG
ncbi:MAG: hypothetical protein OXE43_15420 [Chloroflexi bacterium]|nr:hypothetical protein [Chloroflexota bacterium]